MPEDSYLRRLLHRWFVEYNPLYLFSAVLVLGGTILASRGLAREGSLYGEVGVAAIAELYAAALIGGAALLMRLGQRRSAVMLALLVGLYQCDVTLHTETCPNLGVLGVLGTVGWLGLFVGKLAATGWALRVRLARSTMVTAVLGGAGVALLPYAFQSLGSRPASALVVVWLFALSALVFVRWISTERRVWAVVVATLAFVALRLPGALSATALVAAAALAMRALRARPMVRSTDELRSVPAPPYRHAGDEPRPMGATPVSLAIDPAPAIRRLLTGSAFTLYLSAWTLGWTGGSFPLHALPLDLLLTAVVLLGGWRLRARIALAPLAVTWLHAVLQAQLVPAPTSLVQWGAVSIGLGFAVLLGSLATSWWLGTPHVAEPAETGKMR